MTEQEHLAIRVALARRMGITLEKRWQHVTDPTWCMYDVRLPGGTYLGSHCGSIEEAASKLPDPFTSAAANRELVKWLAKNEEAVIEKFHRELQEIVGPSPICILIAPLSVITLAACKALGIETE